MSLAKPLPGSGRAERRKRKRAYKRGDEAARIASTLESMEFWRQMRLDLWYREGGHCQRCTRLLDLSAPWWMDYSLHAHHIVKKSQGGLDVLENLAALCGGCHRKEHN